jgi:hypothetical protein
MTRNVAVARRFFMGVAVAVLAAGLTACGGGTTTPDTTTSTVTTSLPTQPFANLAASEVAFAEVTINGTGVLTGTADWTFASNDIDIYVTAPSCRATDIVELANCQAVGRTTAVSTKPERLTVNVTQGNYRVWVANFGPGSESGTLQMTATVSR